jgi:hypothetical protein
VVGYEGSHWQEEDLKMYELRMLPDEISNTLSRRDCKEENEIFKRTKFKWVKILTLILTAWDF